MRRLKLIGIGAGNPDYITVQAIKALQQVDVIFLTDKGQETEDLLLARQDICKKYMQAGSYRTVVIEDPRRDRDAGDYHGAVAAWHELRALLYEQLILKHLSADECGAFLVWGDPSLYDSALRIIERVIARGSVQLDCEIIPGISSIQALAARHKIPMNRLGEPIHITTGRRLTGESLSAGANVVVMLDGECAFKTLKPEGVDIYWGAFLGTPDEILLSGKLSEMGGQIEDARAHARKRKGWIMDTYLLRKQKDNPC